MSRPTISIIIATIGDPLLQKSILSISNQSAELENIEIIIVDNKLRGEIPSLITEKKSIKVIRESMQGLSYARNRGFTEASGNYVAYIDDDAVANKDWVDKIVEHIKNSPDIEAFGGPYECLNPKELPSWFPSKVTRMSHGNRRRFLKEGEYLSGTNMIYSRKLLIRLGGFAVNLGMNAGKLGYGEETELQNRIKKMGIKIHYDPSIIVKHYFKKSKMSLNWLFKSAYSHGVSTSQYKSKTFSSHIIGISKSFLYGIFHFIAHIYLPVKNNIFVSFKDTMNRVGEFSGYLGNRA